MISINFGYVEGLPDYERKRLERLKKIYDFHAISNWKKNRYYEGKVTLNDVNLGIALPSTIAKLQIGCSWGAKTVDVLAARSMFDGFVDGNGADAVLINQIAKRNHLISEYMKNCREQLKYGGIYATVYGEKGNARIRFYSPNCAAASWDAEKGQIECGFAFDDGRYDESELDWSPDSVNYYTEDAIWVLSREDGAWKAERYPHSFGKPLMIPLAWDATEDKPFGQSRLKEPVRRLIEGYVRTVANATIGLEFATSPQKYLLGITDSQFDDLKDTKFVQYVGSILLGTVNPETGQSPTYGQLPQGNIQPHVEMMRMLATQFSAATGLTIADTGVVNDANPTSSDAILAQSQTLVLLAEQLNRGNGDALYEIGQMALAIELGTTPDNLPESEKNIIAHFKNPAMPSVAVTADAAIKIAAAREGFASTDIFLEMIGFDAADIRRIKSQEQRAAGQKILTEEFLNDTGRVEPVQEPNVTSMQEGS